MPDNSGTAFSSQIIAKYGPQQGQAFINQVNQMGANLNVSPNWILGAMSVETGGTFSTSAKNGQSGATGLIQMTAQTAAGLNPPQTPASLAAMTPAQQLPYVQQYFQNTFQSTGTPTSYGDLYATVLAPAAVGKPDSAVIYSAPSKAFTQNASLSSNGTTITAGDIRNYANNQIPASQRALVTGSTYQNGVNPSANQNAEDVDDPPLAFNPNYTSPNQYPINSIDFRVGSGFSNLQPVGNGMNLNGNTYFGAPSIFNDYALFRFYGINTANDLYDRGQASPSTSTNANGSGKYISSEWKNPSATVLIDHSTKTGYQQFPYSWTDFLYTKYFGIIPNNKMITLRRYPLPTYDHGLISSASKSGSTFIPGIRQDAFQLPVAQAVTYFGDDTTNKIEELMNFSVGMNWTKQTADVNSIKPEVQGSTNTNSALGKYSAILGILTGKTTGQTASKEANQLSQYDPYDGENAPLKYKVYGPVNVINETYTRGRGLTMDQEFKIDFVYSLRSIGEINPKMAMLDILANMLSLTFNNAKFWGGANRFFPNTPSYPFIGSQSLWFRRDAGGYVGSVFKQMGSAIGNIGDFFSLFSGNPTEALSKLLSGGANLAMGMIQNGNRPQLLSIPSLLTGQPVGEWHLVVGNPLNPTLMIGNLICDKMEVTFNNIMGADDFPTEMTCTVHLKHGRPRDKGDIESMFNQGQGRLYYAYQNQMEPWNKTSSTVNSTNSTIGAVSTTGLPEDAVTWGGKAKNNGTQDLNQTIRNATALGNVTVKSFGKKSYPTDPSDRLAYDNAQSDGGGSN